MWYPGFKETGLSNRMRAVDTGLSRRFGGQLVAAEGCGECFRSFRPRQSGVGFVQGPKKRFPGGVLRQQVPDVLQIVDFEPDGIGRRLRLRVLR